MFRPQSRSGRRPRSHGRSQRRNGFPYSSGVWTVMDCFGSAGTRGIKADRVIKSNTGFFNGGARVGGTWRRNTVLARGDNVRVANDSSFVTPFSAYTGDCPEPVRQQQPAGEGGAARSSTRPRLAPASGPPARMRPPCALARPLPIDSPTPWLALRRVPACADPARSPSGKHPATGLGQTLRGGCNGNSRRSGGGGSRNGGKFVVPHF